MCNSICDLFLQRKQFLNFSLQNGSISSSDCDHEAQKNSFSSGWHLLFRFADGDEIDYYAFLAGINWLEHPAPPVMPEDTLKVRKSRNYKANKARRKSQFSERQ